MTSLALLSGVIAAVVLALVASVVSLFLHWRTGSVHSLESKVNQLGLDLHDLFDTVEKWTRRDRVRRLRDGQEAAGAQLALPARGTPEYKAMLRQKVRAIGSKQ